MGLLRKIRNPELFQGSLLRRAYFEGWYFKLITEDRNTAAAVIPGIALGARRDSPDSHAFVQFILGGRTEYFRYPLSVFSSDAQRFRVTICENEFSRNGIALNLLNEHTSVAGALGFTDVLPFPKTLRWPGIMGPYSYVPGMECYHGIVNIRHTINGSLAVDGRVVPFDGGLGYVEKDWGRGFPSRWIWVQANHFGDGSAFLLSVADIPWGRGSFRGFFAFLHHDGKLHRFATYTGAKLVGLNETDGMTSAALTAPDGTLEFAAQPGPAGLLKAPKNGLMDILIEESISASVAVRLTDRQGGVLFDGISPCAGMERFNHHMLLD